jgi:hypothetical protein
MIGVYVQDVKKKSAKLRDAVSVIFIKKMYSNIRHVSISHITMNI